MTMRSDGEHRNQAVDRTSVSEYYSLIFVIVEYYRSVDHPDVYYLYVAS
jgi:hypothetical protein